MSRLNAPEDFWRFVEKIPGIDCWLWSGVTVRGGYGRFAFNRSKYRAHRFSWIISNGNIPDELQVLHRCDNPPCVNPAHLFLGTNKDNIADKVAKGRASRWAPRGSDGSNAKLTDNQVLSIRDDKRIYRLIAADFGITSRQVCSIKLRRQWKHI